MIAPSSIIANCFSFGPDGPATVECASRLFDIGFTQVRIWEDFNNPFTDECRAKLVTLGCLVNFTPYRRGGNLTGSENFHGQLECLRYGLAADQWSLKIDADTLPIRLDRFQEAAASGARLVGMKGPARAFYGGAYFCRGDFLSDVDNHIKNPPPGKLIILGPEDVTLGMIATDLGDTAGMLPYDIEGCFFAAWRYHLVAKDPSKFMPEYARRFDNITFGSRDLLTGKDCERREQVAAEMHRFRLKIG